MPSRSRLQCVVEYFSSINLSGMPADVARGPVGMEDNVVEQNLEVGPGWTPLVERILCF